MPAFTRLLMVLIAPATLVGCGLDPDPDPAAAPEAAALHAPGASVVAALHPDPDTTITFLRDDPPGGPGGPGGSGGAGEDDGESIDVVVHGRDGGPDYGALITRDGATPLELFLALSDPAAPVPESLRRAHEHRAALLRTGDTAVRSLRPQLAALAPDGDPYSGLSTFTCLSFDNFNTHLSDVVWAGSPGKNVQTTASSAAHQLVSPYPGVWQSGVEADLYACNYNSAGSTPDSILAFLCHWNALQAGASEVCNGMQLADGWYLRRLYTGVTYSRRYRAEATPLSATSLTSFLGVVTRP